MKKLVIALMSFALVVTLAGCGGGGGGGNSQVKSINDLVRSETFPIKCDKIAAAMNAIEADFTSTTKTAEEKKDTLSKYISEDFTRGSEKKKAELTDTMFSRFERYNIDSWKFVVTNHDGEEAKKTANGDEIVVECAIDLKLTLKPGATGNGAGSWQLYNKELVWRNESGNWRIIRGLPYLKEEF